MRAITFEVAVPRYVLSKTLGGLTDAFTLGGLSGVRLGEVPEPELPGAQWVGLDVLGCGICGTDLSNLLFESAPTLEPFASFPAVLGLEVLARVRRVGDAVAGLEVGQRVSVDPMIGCRVRGYEPHEFDTPCQTGNALQCTRAGQTGRVMVAGQPLGPGMSMGYQRQLPGGWGQRMSAHQSQIFPIPDRIDDRRAVLVEPLSIAAHAVLGSGAIEDGTSAAEPRFTAGPVLVIGSGTIALSTVWALRALGYRGQLISVAKRPHEQRRALALGATATVAPGAEARAKLIETGARSYKPIIGPEVYAGGGFPLIFDCVGSQSSLQQALLYATVRGRIVMLGCVAELPRLDLTFVWARELELKGYSGYGLERWRARQMHTYRVVHELLLEHHAPVSDLISHSYSLDEFRRALRVAADHRRSGAIKVILSGQPERFAPPEEEGGTEHA